MVADVSAGADGGPSIGRSRRVFDDADVMLAAPSLDGAFIVVRRTREHQPLTTMNVVLAWTRELGRTLPVGEN
jgi:hypothetical protein